MESIAKVLAPDVKVSVAIGFQPKEPKSYVSLILVRYGHQLCDVSVTLLCDVSVTLLCDVSVTLLCDISQCGIAL